MTNDTSQENNALSGNKKYIVLAVVLILLGSVVYFIFTPDKEAGKESPTEEVAVEDRTEMESLDEEGSLEGDENVDTDVMVEESVESEEGGEVKLPDLYIKEFSFKDDPKQNEEVTVKITLGNKGTADARDFNWEWWAEEDESGCDGYIDFLEVSDSKTFECDYTYTGSDTYDSTVVVDSEDDVSELNEDNNEATEEVTPEEELKADLYISEYSFDPVPEKAVPFTVRIGIKNKGNTSSGEFYWEWWPTAYNYACREKISEIAPNSEKVVTCDYTYGGWSTYPTKAVADADDEVEEFDEDNNTYTETVVPIH